MSRAGRSGRGEPSSADRLRVLVLCALLLVVVGAVALSFAVFGGSGSWWALTAFCLVVGGLVGWAAAREWRRAPAGAEPAMSRRDLARYFAVAVGLVVLTFVVHGIAAL